MTDTTTKSCADPDTIATIEALYPIDSRYPKTSEIGKRLLMQALKHYDWRKLPMDLLRRYAELCAEQERREAAR